MAEVTKQFYMNYVPSKGKVKYFKRISWTAEWHPDCRASGSIIASTAKTIF